MCTASDVAYSINNGGADFITFDPATRVLRCESSDSSKAGTYNITLTGTIVNTAQGDKTTTTTFNLVVYESVSNCGSATEVIQLSPSSLSDI